MKDIVLLPTWYRPEYLQLCLEHLAAAQGIESKQIWILQDYHVNDERTHALEEQWTQEVLGNWRLGLDIKFMRSTPHMTGGNSRNVMEGYRRAFETDAKYVYQIEDDVFVTPDLFRWHETVQNDGNYFCSVGYNCKFKWPADFKPDDNPGDYYTAYYYGSYGVGWKRENLAAIVPHANDAYYTSMDAYVRQNLGGTRLGDRFTEQDGLIERVMLRENVRPIAFPVVSRAFHMGLYGYHRKGQRPSGFLEAKIKGLKQLLADPATFTNHVNNPYNDILPFAFPGNWSTLTKVATFL